MDTTVALVVGPAAGLLGVGLGYLGSRHVSREERRVAARAELRRALASYLGAIYPLVAELRAMPEVRATRISDIVERLSSDAAVYVRSRRQIAKLGPRPLELMDRFVAMTANLQVLPKPAPLEAAFTAANDYVEQLTETRSEELKNGWPEIWRSLQLAATVL